MNSDVNSRGIWAWDVVKYVVGLSILIFCVLFFSYGWTEEAVMQNMRWSARISFTLFCLSFASSAIHHWTKNSLSWWLRMNRRYLGISFAIIHIIHLGFVILLQINFHPVFNMAACTSIMGGGIAYLFVVFMLATSFERFAQYLNPKQWKTLHTLGGYWILAIFMSTYLKRVDEPVHWLFVIILVIVLGLRASYLLRSKFVN